MLQKIIECKLVPKAPNRQVRNKVKTGNNVIQSVIRRKLGLFGHICRMKDARLVKSIVFGMMEGTKKRGRPIREWLDDI